MKVTSSFEILLIKYSFYKHLVLLQNKKIKLLKYLSFMQKGHIAKQQTVKGVKDPLIKGPNPIITERKSMKHI